MLNQPYFPSPESERATWITHYISKLPIHAVKVGISQNEVATTIRELSCYKWISQELVPGAQNYGLETTALRNSVAYDSPAGIQPLPVPVSYSNPPEMCPSGVLTRLFTQVQRIKLSDNYTDSIGQDLGIIGSSKVDTHTYPEYILFVTQGENHQQVAIKFKKYGHDAVSIESRRNNGDWENLAIAMQKPWYVNRPLLVPNTPEVREYRLRWCDKDQLGEIFSPVQKVTIGA